MDFRQSRFFRLPGLLCLAVVLLAAVTKFLVAPALIRWQVQRTLQGYWDGAVEIGQVEFNFSGLVALRDIHLKDPQGRTWATLDQLAMVLDNWPGFNPTPSVVTGTALEIRAHFVDGKCRPPLRTPPPGKVSRIKSLSVCVEPVTVFTCKPDVIPLAGEASIVLRVQDGAFWGGVTCKQLCRGELLIDANGILDDSLAVTDYRGIVKIANANMPEILRAVAVKSEMKEGVLAARLVVKGKGLSLDAVRGKGLVQMDRAHLAGIPLVKAILDYVGLADMGNFRVRGGFSLDGPLLVVDRARLTNPLSAFDIEPNGTIHLVNRQMDLCVVAGLMTGMQNAVNKIHLPVVSPLVNITGNLLQSLTRIQVCGGWNDPPETLLHKDLVRDLQDGTLKFFTDALTPGGKPAEESDKSFDELFKALDQPRAKNGKPGIGAASGPAASNASTSASASLPASAPAGAGSSRPANEANITATSRP